MESLLRAVIFASLALHALLLLYVVLRRGQVRIGHLWLAATLLLSALAISTLLLPANLRLAEKFGRGAGLTFGLAAMLVTFGALVATDVLRQRVARGRRLWLVVGLLWLIGLIITGFLSNNITIAEGEWLVATFSTRNPFALFATGGLGVVSVVLFGIAFYAFYVAPLPEIANRALFWVITTAVLLVGVILLVSGTTALILLGVVTLLVGVFGTVYAEVSHRVLDIRSGLSLGLRTALLIALNAVVVYAVLIATDRLPIQTETE
ncbi:MAG TPA: hypothetical protein VHO69_13620, partial [Phototrophicaceae bacterium]|nr:hypothetical protein [Phototrophicaceae bacterium]